MLYLGDFAAGSVVRLFWNSNGSDGQSITRATNGSLRIYKNNSTTERSSASGITDTEDFDSLTGVHHANIDTSDNTDAGFYAAGNDYFVVLATATIDGQTVNHCLAAFSIENRSALRPTTAGRTLTVESDGMAHADCKEWLGGTIATPTITGVPEVDLTHWLGTAAATPTVAGVPEVDVTHYAGSTTNVSTMPASLAAVLADTNELQTDWVDGGRLDLLLDAAATSSDVTSAVTSILSQMLIDQSEVITAIEDVPTVTEFNARTLPSADYTIVSDLGTVQSGDAYAIVNSGTHGNAALKTLLDSIVADTNELQGDWANGGRLDLLIDAIKAKTDSLTFTTASKVDATLTLATDIGAAAANRLADHVLRRSSASARASSYGDAVAFRSLLGATSKLTNKIGPSGNNLITYEEDDTTVFGTQAMTTDAAADPITALDTA